MLRPGLEQAVAQLDDLEECVCQPETQEWQPWRCDKGSPIIYICCSIRQVRISSFWSWKVWVITYPSPMPCSLPFLNHATLPDIPGHVQTEERLPIRLRQAGRSRDVFALVKSQMSDLHLSQPPLLVLPESLIHETENFFNAANSTSHVIQQSLEPERCEELQRLSAAFQQDYNHLNRAVNYYKDLVNPNRFRFPYTKLEFVAAGPSAHLRLGEIQLGARPPPPKPRHLQVVFHRA